MTIDTKKLRELAEAATPGPWEHQNENGYPWIDGPFDELEGVPYTVVEWSDTGRESQANAAFIAAANPQTVIALLDEIEKLRSRQQELLATIVRVTNETPFPEEVAGALGQRGALLAEIGSLRSQLAAANAEIERLRLAVAAAPSHVDSTLHLNIDELAALRTDCKAWKLTCSVLEKANRGLEDQLAAMTKARDEACDIAGSWLAGRCGSGPIRQSQRIAELRKVGQGKAGA